MRAEGRRLDALCLAAIELRIDAELALGPDVALIAELEALVVEHPLRERFWEQLMLGLYRVEGNRRRWLRTSGRDER